MTATSRARALAAGRARCSLARLARWALARARSAPWPCSWAPCASSRCSTAAGGCLRTIVMVAIITLVGGLVRGRCTCPPRCSPLLQAAALLVSLALLFARDEARWGFLPGPAAIARLRELAAQGRDYAEATQAAGRTRPGPAPAHRRGDRPGRPGGGHAGGRPGPARDDPGAAGALFVVPWAINRGSAPGWTFVVVAAGLAGGPVGHSSGSGRRCWSPEARPGSPGVGPRRGRSHHSPGPARRWARLPARSRRTGRHRHRVPAAGPVEVDALVSLRRSLVSNDTRPVITLATTATRPDYLRLSILELFDGEQWQPVGPQRDRPPAAGPRRWQRAVSRSATRRPAWRSTSSTSVRLGGTTLPSPNGSYLSLNDWPVVVGPAHLAAPARGRGHRRGGPDRPRGNGPGPRRRRPAGGQHGALPVPSRCSARTSPTRPPLTGEELPQLAREITAGSATPFDAAIALQRWFTTDGGFTYSTQVEGGSDEDALAAFLEERVGYCEQFAADDGPDGPVGRHPGPGGGRVHPGPPRGQPVGRARDRCPRLARALDGLGRVGPVRADTRSPDDHDPGVHPRRSRPTPTSCTDAASARRLRQRRRRPTRLPDERGRRCAGSHEPHGALPVLLSILVVLAGPAPAARGCSARSPSAPPAHR